MTDPNNAEDAAALTRILVLIESRLENPNDRKCGVWWGGVWWDELMTAKVVLKELLDNPEGLE